MEPKDTDPVASELAERIARLEADVAWLVHLAGRPRPDAAPKIPGPTATRSTPAVDRHVRSAPFQGRLSPNCRSCRCRRHDLSRRSGVLFRWAIQEGWIGPMLRVALGLIAGSGLTMYASRRLLVEPRRLAIALLVAGLSMPLFRSRSTATGAWKWTSYVPMRGSRWSWTALNTCPIPSRTGAIVERTNYYKRTTTSSCGFSRRMSARRWMLCSTRSFVPSAVGAPLPCQSSFGDRRDSDVALLTCRAVWPSSVSRAHERGRR